MPTYVTARVAINISIAKKIQTHGFWHSWDRVCGFHSGDFAVVPESCRTFWTPLLPPSRCRERCQWRAEKGQKVGKLYWSACDRLHRPKTRTEPVSAACVSRSPPPVSSRREPTTYSRAAARRFSDEKAYLLQTMKWLHTNKLRVKC